MKQEKKRVIQQNNRHPFPINIIRFILTFTLFIFLIFSLLANSIFQLDFFSKRWLLESNISYLLFFVENGGKVLIEIIAFTIFSSSKGILKYVTTVFIWMLLLYLIFYSIFQTFNSRTYLTQYESEKSRIEEIKNQNSRIKKQIKSLELLMEIESKTIETGVRLQSKKGAIILESIKKTKNQWLISKNLKMFNQKFDHTHSYERLARLREEIDKLNKKLQHVGYIPFSYTQSLDNVFEGNVKLWDIIADLGISIGLEGLIFTLVIGLFFIWKNEAIIVSKSMNSLSAIDQRAIHLDYERLNAISGNKLKEIRLENESVRGLSFSQFAKFIGLTDNELTKYEALGKVLIPVSVVIRLDEIKSMDMIY